MHASSLLVSFLAAISVTKAEADAKTKLPKKVRLSDYGNPMLAGVSWTKDGGLDVTVTTTSAIITPKYQMNPFGNFSWYMQADANFCGYHADDAYGAFCSGPGGEDCTGYGGCRFAFQPDGNCCIYWPGAAACTNTQGQAEYLVLTGVSPYFFLYDENMNSLPVSFTS